MPMSASIAVISASASDRVKPLIDGLVIRHFSLARQLVGSRRSPKLAVDDREVNRHQNAGDRHALLKLTLNGRAKTQLSVATIKPTLTGYLTGFARLQGQLGPY